ncbi:MAG: phage tail tip lysozyme [Candidatus Thorarchaeota archaeon]
MTRKLFTCLTVSATILGGACVASTRLDDHLAEVTGETVVQEIVEEEPVKPQPVEIVVEKWDCPDCTTNERYVLSKLQEYTPIEDRNALATIMGNIKSESNFNSNICEGGARVPYERCYSGGYGLIQWTSIGRYRGLGNFAIKYNCNPSELDCQVRWMVNEPQFQQVLPSFAGHGQSISQYMRPAYRWLGWGIKGYRESYAHDYYAKMVKVTVHEEL